MDRIPHAASGLAASRRGMALPALHCGLALIAGLALSGCSLTSASSSAPAGSSGTAAADASPAVSIPGTHRSTAVYAISGPVSALVVTSRVGNVTVTGAGGSAASVTEEITYTSKPPATTRSVSGGTLTVGYSCPVELVCAVVYRIRVPRTAAIQVTANAGRITLSGLSGQVTAKADAGLITATGLAGASVSLTTDVGAITADFAAAPVTIAAVTRIGAITLRVPSAASYLVIANASFGQATVRIPQDPSAPHTIRATADVGAILVTYLGASGQGSAGQSIGN